jgi:hypothetical protein
MCTERQAQLARCDKDVSQRADVFDAPLHLHGLQGERRRLRSIARR